MAERVTGPTSEMRRELLRRVVATVDATNQLYAEAKLFPLDINPQPILYFGDPLTAKFATFGVNPAAAELTLPRWPNRTMTVEELDRRKASYFKNPDVTPSRWFDGYDGPSKALSFLGHSYRSDTIHLDFSPRATTPRATAAKKLSNLDLRLFVQRFREMVIADLLWFISTLALCPNVKAAIMAGAVTNRRRDYLDQFLQEHLPRTHKLTLRRYLELQRPGATALYDLVGPQLSIPVLFVSASPSGDRGTKLAREVKRNLDTPRQAGF